MVPEAHHLHTALVSAFPAYTTKVFSERGYPLDRRSVEAIEAATAVLDSTLAIELERPFREQRRSPLELFRAALDLVAEALGEGEIAPTVAADVTTGSDPYGLAPGSSSVLGAEAHSAHMAWGAAKAAAFTGGAAAKPTVQMFIIVSSNRDDREAIIAAVRDRGLPCRAERNPAGVAAAIADGSVLAAAVDLSHRSGREVIARLVAASVPTVVYGDAVDDLVTTGLLTQGVRTVVERERFLADPPAFLPALA